MKKLLLVLAACAAANLFAADTGGVTNGDQTWAGHKQLGEMANVAAKGVTIARSGTTAAWRVYSDDEGAALNGTGSVPDLRGSLSRFLITVNQTGGHVRLHGAYNMLASYNGYWNTEVAAGSTGVVQIVNTATKTFGGYAATGTNYESGVKITAITNVSTTATGVMKMKVGTVDYYVPLWAAAQLDGE